MTTTGDDAVDPADPDQPHVVAVIGGADVVVTGPFPTAGDALAAATRTATAGEVCHVVPLTAPDPN